MQESPLKALAVLLTVALVCSVLVSVSAVVLRPIQEANERIERYRHIVALTGLTEAGQALDDAQVEAAVTVLRKLEPGAAAAVEGCRGGSHLVLATEATVRLGAYRSAILSLDAEADVTEHACELLVALAEEGWVDGAIAQSIVRRYLDESHAASPDTIILGCTHFPLLTNTIRSVAGDNVRIVDSAVTTAAVVRAFLAQIAG